MFREVDYSKNVLIGTPLVGWKVAKNEHKHWISDIANIKQKFSNVKFFAALEVDSRGISEYGSFIDEMKSEGIDFWTYMINDNESIVNSQNRWVRIETGRNLVREYAQRLRRVEPPHWGGDVSQLAWTTYDAVLYVDSDMGLTCEILEKMLEIDHYMVSVDVPIYCLSGPIVSDSPRVEEHWNTAGLLLVNAPQYYDLPWYSNRNLNLSDDPTFQHLAHRLYGSLTWVRKDISAKHAPVDAVESRMIPPRQND